MGLNGMGWDQMGPNDIGWDWIGSDGMGWNRMKPNGIDWVQIGNERYNLNQGRLEPEVFQKLLLKQQNWNLLQNQILSCALLGSINVKSKL